MSGRIFSGISVPLPVGGLRNRGACHNKARRTAPPDPERLARLQGALARMIANRRPDLTWDQAWDRSRIRGSVPALLNRGAVDRIDDVQRKLAAARQHYLEVAEPVDCYAVRLYRDIGTFPTDFICDLNKLVAGGLTPAEAWDSFLQEHPDACEVFAELLHQRQQVR